MELWEGHRLCLPFCKSYHMPLSKRGGEMWILACTFWWTLQFLRRLLCVCVCLVFFLSFLSSHRKKSVVFIVTFFKTSGKMHLIPQICSLRYRWITANIYLALCFRQLDSKQHRGTACAQSASPEIFTVASPSCLCIPLWLWGSLLHFSLCRCDCRGFLRPDLRKYFIPFKTSFNISEFQGLWNVILGVDHWGLLHLFKLE